MRTTLLTLASAITTATATYQGFNFAANLASGACRTQADWEFAFNKIQSFPNEFTNARLYASSDCNTLANAVPAAINTNTKILVGVWTQDDAHFEAEKQALLEAIQTHGKDWILAVSVGSEDLYREETTAATLASKINDVRGMLWSLGASDKQITHVDTWTAWVDGANTAVIEAVDFVSSDAYAYWQGISIDNGAASDAHWQALNAVKAVAQGKEVWLTETGWPISGDTVGNAVPSVDALQTFWYQAFCNTKNEYSVFWYTFDEFAGNPSFSTVDQSYNALIDMNCS